MTISHQPEQHGLRIDIEGWDGFGLASRTPGAVVGRKSLETVEALSRDDSETGAVSGIEWRLSSGDLDCVLRFSFTRIEDGVLVEPEIETGGREMLLNHLTLLDFSGNRGGALGFDADPGDVRVLVESGYASKVRDYSELLEGTGGSRSFDGAEDADVDREPNTEERIEPWNSRGHWLAYDRRARRAHLIGFVTADRWEGTISLVPDDSAAGSPGFTVGFDGGDTILPGNSTIMLERFVMLHGDDPFALLDRYARIAAGDAERSREPGLISWCSWYPYRLSVTEERILENARMAAERLAPLGMSIIEADLGWEDRYLPSAFEENDQFPGGLAGLSKEVKSLGFTFGVWKAPFTVSEYDELVNEHPDWLICDEAGVPIPYWTWYWEPHGNVYIRDLTNPKSVEDLRRRLRSLRERGVRYFKPDFISCVRNEPAKGRADHRIVAGGGVEMARIGAEAILDAFPGDPVLNCGGPDIPGRGAFPLIYGCNDTGSTASLTHEFMRDNYHALACHLFKNRIWGLIQPSCLSVGLPGTIDEARLRASIAYLAGGQVDISDDLTSLPERRWEIISATLPPPVRSATPVDLFDPIPGLPAGSVWVLPVESSWDTWTLVGIFAFEAEAGGAGVRTVEIPLDRLGIDPADAEGCVGFEFWDSLYLGPLADRRRNPPGTDHPGDLQELLTAASVGTIRVSFAGQAVKLLAIRRRRNHPWVVGSTFHQSAGEELGVRWDGGSLRFSLNRPAGSSGCVIIDPAGYDVEEIDPGAGRCAPAIRTGAAGSLVVPVTADGSDAEWVVRFRSLPGRSRSGGWATAGGTTIFQP